MNRTEELGMNRIEGKEMTQVQEKSRVATRMSGDERRNQILQVAISLFSQKGFSGTTTKEIAQAAGISEAMVFRHFANKQELYTAILDYKSCEAGIEQTFLSLEEAMEKKIDDKELFYNLALNALIYHQKDQEFLRLLLHSALEGHEFSELFVMRKIAPLYQMMARYIEQRQREGIFRKDIDARMVVRCFVGMLVHHSMNKLLWDTEQKLVKVSDEEAARAFSEILLSGITTQEKEK